MAWRRGDAIPRKVRSAAGPGHDEVVIQRAIGAVHLAPVWRHAWRMLREVGDQSRTHAEGYVAIDMLAAADEDMGCESIGGLGLNRKMEVRGSPVAARRVADQFAESGVHGRGVGGRHHAPERIVA